MNETQFSNPTRQPIRAQGAAIRAQNRPKNVHLDRQGRWRNNRDNSLYWTPSMLDILRRHYPECTAAEVAQMLGMSAPTVLAKARKLRLARKADFAKTLNARRALIAGATVRRKIRNLEQCGTQAQVECVAAPGVRRKVYKGTNLIAWTDEMLRTLRDNYPHRSATEVARMLDMSDWAVRRKAVKLGLKHTPDYYERVNRLRNARNTHPNVRKLLSEPALSRLKAIYPDTPTPEVARFFGVELDEVVRVCRRIGLRKSDEFRRKIRQKAGRASAAKMWNKKTLTNQPTKNHEQRNKIQRKTD